MFIPHTAVFHYFIAKSPNEWEFFINYPRNLKWMKNLILQEELSLPGKRLNVLVSALSWNTADMSGKKIKILNNI